MITTAESGGGIPAAFFDLDRTLVAGSSGVFWARAARDAGLITTRQLLGFAGQNLRFRLRGSTDAWTEQMRAEVATVVTGRSAVELRRMLPEVLVGVLARLQPEVLEVAYEHQDAGHRVYIATASGQALADLLSTVLGFDGGIGARSEVVDGLLTGRDDGPFTYREGKAQRVRELAAAEGIDLGASWAYSDSESDLPMLRLVRHPVAVNPDAALARIADAEGWEVIHAERLGRRLSGVAAVTAMALAGAAATAARARARSRP
ncbi:MAG: HAD-IB family hydrolase [Actinobacteria bacterium]|nr:HAD-IB family hydrolase [Actinomycetota bacterium]